MNKKPVVVRSYAEKYYIHFLSLLAIIKKTFILFTQMHLSVSVAMQYIIFCLYSDKNNLKDQLGSIDLIS